MENLVTDAFRNPSPAFWAGKRVLVTGHTGFKGSWLSVWLHKLGSTVCGISLPAPTKPSLYQEATINELVISKTLDIRNREALIKVFDHFKPDLTFHLAAQALVRPSYQSPIETFETNVLGTANVLEALRVSDRPGIAVIVTTDKVYENLETGKPFVETDPLGGHDPYSASKAAAELVTASYDASFLNEQGLITATARAGNVIGGGDWAVDRLIPDAIRAWTNHRTLSIRSPHSTRPWQHVLEPLCGYLLLAESLSATPSLGGAYNFGPIPEEAATVRKVIEEAQTHFQFGETTFADTPQVHEAKWLALCPNKAKEFLGYDARWDIERSIQESMLWYQNFYNGKSARELTMQNIADFEATLRS